MTGGSLSPILGLNVLCPGRESVAGDAFPEGVPLLEIEPLRFHEVMHCVAVCNATIGLEIAISALPMAGEVIGQSLTFVATAHALQWQQIKPIFSVYCCRACSCSGSRDEMIRVPWAENMLPQILLT